MSGTEHGYAGSNGEAWPGSPHRSGMTTCCIDVHVQTTLDALCSAGDVPDVGTSKSCWTN